MYIQTTNSTDISLRVFIKIVDFGGHTKIVVLFCQPCMRFLVITQI